MKELIRALDGGAGGGGGGDGSGGEGDASARDNHAETDRIRREEPERREQDLAHEWEKERERERDRDRALERHVEGSDRYGSDEDSRDERSRTRPRRSGRHSTRDRSPVTKVTRKRLTRRFVMIFGFSIFFPCTQFRSHPHPVLSIQRRPKLKEPLKPYVDRSNVDFPTDLQVLVTGSLVCACTCAYTTRTSPRA